MTVSAEMVGSVRRMVGEPDDSNGYTDDLLEAVIGAHAVEDALGREPYYWDHSTTPPTQTAEENWVPTYDLELAAAEIWEEKAAKVAGGFDFSADGARFEQGQVYEHCMKMARHHRSRRMGRNRRVMASPGGGV